MIIFSNTTVEGTPGSDEIAVFHKGEKLFHFGGKEDSAMSIAPGLAGDLLVKGDGDTGLILVRHCGENVILLDPKADLKANAFVDKGGWIHWEADSETNVLEL